ncbi:MAG: sterol desaturase family protein [Alphaproteobacteria bacterium]
MESLLASTDALIATWQMIFIHDTARYLVAASVMAAILAIFSHQLAARKLQARLPRPGQISREIRYSLLTGFIFSINGLLTAVATELGWTQVYGDIADYGVGYLIVSLLLMIVLHDAYFYWTHRVIHHPALFKWVHRTHHRSRTPTPWTAYAFDPAEAVVNAVFMPVLTFVMPLHPLVIFVFMAHMIIRNVIGHSGHELFPKTMKHHPVFGAITNVLHHDLHHRDMTHNYGLYFSWWDRWMGTEHPDYRADKPVAKPTRRKFPLPVRKSFVSFLMVAGASGASTTVPSTTEVSTVTANIKITPFEDDQDRLCASVLWEPACGQETAYRRP